MRRVLVVAALLVPLAAGRARAQNADSSTAQGAITLLSVLADDSMEGRDTGSKGGAAAARVIARELARAGLQPAGDSGFFQRVPLAWRMVPGRNNRPPRRAMVLLPDFAALDTVPEADRVHAVNVVAILPGSDSALHGEAVLIDAHYDHIGMAGSGACRARGADSICNGADDDASGTVAVLETARLLAAGPAPRRTVVFLLVTGEERGTLGSRWYLAHPAAPLARTTANLEIEMIGRPDSLAGGPGKAWLTGFDRSTMGRMLRDNGIPLVPDPRPAENFFERSDNIIFAYQGIPAHTISSFNLHTDYHAPTDETRLVDAAHLAAVINAVARATRLLADGPAPAWLPGGQPLR